MRIKIHFDYFQSSLMRKLKLNYIARMSLDALDFSSFETIPKQNNFLKR